jgi:hypothetical protein
MFFSEEKNQKLLSVAGGGMRGAGRSVAAGVGAKVFWFFSSEKNFFLERRKIRGLLPGSGSVRFFSSRLVSSG